MATLPKKSDTPFATDDDHHAMMAADPSITQFPTGSAFGQPTTSSFGSVSTFGQTTTTSSFGSSSASSGPTAALTTSGSNAAEGAEVLLATDDKFGKFINSKWRPLFAMMYLMTCVCDFTLFPVLWSVMQALTHGSVSTQWQPLTLQGAGLFHLACGAVLGVAAYGRTQEKIAGKS